MTARQRDLAIQGTVLAVVAAICLFLIHNLISNLHRLGIATGFGFLSAPAGFDVSFKLSRFDAASTYAQAFLIGLSNTLLVSAIGIVLCTVIGVCVGVARWSRLPILADLGAIYVELFRNVPLLLQVFFWYFGVLRALPPPAQSIGFGDVVFLNNRGLWLPAPILSSFATAMFGAAETAFISGAIMLRFARRRRIATGRRSLWFSVGCAALAAGLVGAVVAILAIDWDIARKTRFGLNGGMEIVPEFASLLAALSIYFGSYAAENVRAGLDGVGVGQLDAARALGLTFWQSLRRVALPQALRGILPPLTGIYLTLVKASAIGAAIAFPELLQIGTTTLNQTGDALAVSFILVVAYLSINVSISVVLGFWERRTGRWAA